MVMLKWEKSCTSLSVLGIYKNDTGAIIYLQIVHIFQSFTIFLEKLQEPKKDLKDILTRIELSDINGQSKDFII